MTAYDPATFAWSRRVLRIGGFIQVAFAAFWLIRGSLYLGGALAWESAVGLAVAAALVFGYGMRVTAGRGTRPSGSEAARIERGVTVATVAQLAASFIAPEIAIHLGRPDWILPSIAITIGPLLLWLSWRLDLPRYRWFGTVLTVGPIGLAFMLSGATLAVVTGIGAGALLLVTAGLGFRELHCDGGPTTGSRVFRRATGSASTPRTD